MSHLANRFSRGIVVYNTNNSTKGIVLDGTRGEDSDPSSAILELGYKGLFINVPPNRALIPTGEYFDLGIIEQALRTEKEKDA